MRRIGVLMPLAADDPEAQLRLAALAQGLQQLGWTIGRNVRIETRWSAGNADDIRKYAVELAALAPDVILANGGAAVAPLLQVTRALPVVFVVVPDPVGSGFVDSLARPGGNITGFLSFEYGMSGKWLELLKQIAPGVTRAAVIRDAAISAGVGQWAAIQGIAPSLGVEVIPVNVRDAGEIERAVAAFARSAADGMVVTGSALSAVHRRLIARWRPGTSCRRSIGVACPSLTAASSPTALTWSTSSGARRATSIASSRVGSLRICQCRHRPSTTWSSISRLQKRSASTYRRRCSRAPTR